MDLTDLKVGQVASITALGGGSPPPTLAGAGC